MEHYTGILDNYGVDIGGDLHRDHVEWFNEIGVLMENGGVVLFIIKIRCR